MNKTFPKPPYSAEKLLKIFTHQEEEFDHLYTFRELYYYKHDNEGKLKADLWYWRQALYTIPKFQFAGFIWSLVMFKNYFKIALRNIKNQKLYNAINICGLSTGLSCFILIFFYVFNELNHDRFNNNAARIYKVAAIRNSGTYMGTNRYSVMPPALAPAMMEEFPEVESAVRLDDESAVLIKTDKNAFLENGWVWADKQIFDIFTFPLIQGDKNEVLSSPFSVVISEKTAKKYFGNRNPVGEIINYRNQHDFRITGIFRNIPEDSHIKGDFFAQFETLAKLGRDLNKWTNNSYHTFFLLKEGADQRQLEAKYPALKKSKFGPVESWREKQKDKWFNQKFTDIHLKSGTMYDFGRSGDIQNVYIFSIIGGFILIIACVNYINLSSARAVKRAREVGLRKVVGALRSQLMVQFLGESLFFTLLSLVFAIGLVYLLLPGFNQIIERNLSMGILGNPGLFLTIIFTVLAAGLISGLYPAFVLSNFKPAKILKGTGATGQRGKTLRNALVVFQFSISIFLIISTIIISKQLYFIRNKDLGFQKDRIICSIMWGDNLRNNNFALKEELLKLPGISGVTYCSSLPMQVGSTNYFRYEGMPDNVKYGLKTYMAAVEYDYLKTFGMEIVKGRNFSKIIDKNSPAYIINESAAEKLGWQNPVGKLYGNGRKLGTVVGVVKDFHYTDFHVPVEPVTFKLSQGNWMWMLAIKINSENFRSTLKSITSVWDKFSNGYPFEYEFMDDKYDLMYKNEIRLGTSFTYFSILAVLICCLGLFGLASFTIEQKTREVGIRKVLGASVPSMVTMFSWSFIKWVILANIIAWPASWIAMNLWLQDFVFRIDPGWSSFAAGTVLSVLIALSTILLQVNKASNTNPADSLRHE